jgi:DNA replication ATP-dependent helicase Dna2
VVAKLAKDLMQGHGVEPGNLAIVSPLKAHNELIRKKLQSLLRGDKTGKNVPMHSLFIDTVNRVQGQEREVVIYSLCSSSERYLLRNADLLYDPHRLNVAITRSKTRLFVVGSRYFFPHISGFIVDAEHLRIWEDYYDYLVENGHRVSYPS